MSAISDPTLPLTPLRRWRRESGVSYAELARRTGRSVRQILRIAAGAAPSPETARAIRRETGVDLNEVFESALPPEPRAPRQEHTLVITPVQVPETPANRAVALSRAGHEPRARRRGVDL